MKFIKSVVGAICVMTVSASARAQVVQTFEDFGSCNGVSPNVGVYGNVNYLLQWTCYSNIQPPFNAHSGTNRVFASAGADNTNSASFTFAPASFSGAWFSGTANVMFLLFLGASQVGTSSSLATSATPTFLSSSFSGPVDRVTVVGNSPSWVMDDVTFRAVTVSPEPASIALVASGLLMIGSYRLRRRRTRTAATLG